MKFTQVDEFYCTILYGSGTGAQATIADAGESQKAV